jgi:hypothetical protein
VSSRRSSGSPSGLYELLAAVLGLEDLTSAAARLAQARKAREGPLSDVKKTLPELLGRLESAGGERAAPCQDALTGRTWDLAAAQLAATGARAAPDGGELGRLRRLVQLTAPAEDEVREAAAALRLAATGLEAVAGTPAGQARALAGLLTAALQHHDSHGDGGCPVCGQPAALTGQRRQATEREVDRLSREARAAEAAEEAADDARRQAAALMQPSPPVLAEAPPGMDPGPARAAWKSWVKPPDAGTPATAAGLRALAAHLDQALVPLTREISALSARASAKHSERDDRWAPVAAAVSSWCADAARSSWAMLRQESNVDLGLDPAGRVNDKPACGAGRQRGRRSWLGAGRHEPGRGQLAGAELFLPRARLPASPFRFLVIDDPVQAMDPAKVDGLARVLEKAASDRQVIVFTHDNRLARAVRQLRLPAAILEVTRRPASDVEVRDCLDPVEQALRDAGALAADQSVPAELRAQLATNSWC